MKKTKLNKALDSFDTAKANNDYNGMITAFADASRIIDKSGAGRCPDIDMRLPDAILAHAAAHSNDELISSLMKDLPDDLETLCDCALRVAESGHAKWANRLIARILAEIPTLSSMYAEYAAPIYRSLGAAYYYNKRYKEALQYFKRAVVVMEANRYPDIDVASGKHNVARLQMILHQYDNAANVLACALTILNTNHCNETYDSLRNMITSDLQKLEAHGYCPSSYMRLSETALFWQRARELESKHLTERINGTDEDPSLNSDV